MIFRIGDRVKSVVDNASDNGDIMKGCLGTIVDLTPGNNPPIGVEWDSRVYGGHNCGGFSKNYHGWYVEKEEIALNKKSNINRW